MVNHLEPKSASHRVGTNIRTLRTDLEMTQAELADAMAKMKSPVHLNTISKIERGDREISVNELEAFALVFGVTTESLLVDSGDPVSDHFREQVTELVEVCRMINTLIAHTSTLDALEESLRMQSADRPDLRSFLDDALWSVDRGPLARRPRRGTVASARVGAANSVTKKSAAKKTTKKGGK